MTEGIVPVRLFFARLRSAAQSQNKPSAPHETKRLGGHVVSLLTQFCQGCEFIRKGTIELIQMKWYALYEKVYITVRKREMNQMNGAHFDKQALRTSVVSASTNSPKLVKRPITEGIVLLNIFSERLKSAARTWKGTVRYLKFDECMPSWLGEHVARLLTQICQGCDLSWKSTIELIRIKH
jgi:hypothetical protein